MGRHKFRMVNYINYKTLIIQNYNLDVFNTSVLRNGIYYSAASDYLVAV